MYICGDTNVDLMAESGYVPNLFGCLPLESPPQVKIIYIDDIFVVRFYSGERFLMKQQMNEGEKDFC